MSEIDSITRALDSAEKLAEKSGKLTLSVSELLIAMRDLMSLTYMLIAEVKRLRALIEQGKGEL